jgi:hypothetical protein
MTICNATSTMRLPMTIPMIAPDESKGLREEEPEVARAVWEKRLGASTKENGISHNYRR